MILQTLYEQFESEIEKHYKHDDYTTRYMHCQRISYLSRTIMHHPGAKRTAIDIGCGRGIYTVLLTTVGFSTVGIDISKEGIRTAKTWTSSEGLSKYADFVACSAESLPFKEGCFDRALCSEVIEHLGDPQKGIKEIARVLGKGGEAILTVPNLVSYYWMRRRIGYDILRFLRKKKRNLETERHTRFTLLRIVRLLREMNFTILSAYSTNILPAPFSLMRNPLIYRNFMIISEEMDNQLRRTPLKSFGSSSVVIARRVSPKLLNWERARPCKLPVSILASP